ncbi:hypothetical protein SNA15_00530, partial [Escherichia coli]|nr:hypothetical protein [Escherichia coli]
RGCNPAYSKSIHTWLRFGEIMRGSLSAQRVTLELSGCPIDANGFCPMDKFDSVLNEAVK